MATIPEQVRLSPAIALSIVLQGIKVRLGRSVVTLAGVALGIAFLSSILTGRIIEGGVAHEKQLRVDVGRMMSFLTAETGDLKDRSIGLIVERDPDAGELRFLKAIDGAGAKLEWTGAHVSAAPYSSANKVASETDFHEPSAIVVIGDPGANAHGIQWNDVLSKSRQRVLAFTDSKTTMPAVAPLADGKTTTVVRLNRELSDEEKKEAKDTATRGQARDLWIIIISLGVTVIGITNSMLMSVTERFREIGTMRCLGAVSGFIRRLFLIESSLVGVFGAAIGALGGGLFAVTVYGARFGFPLVLGSLNFGGLALDFVLAVIAGVILSILAALYPAGVAARMVPATALRTNV